MPVMKSADQCRNLDDVRVEVNRVDEAIVALLAEREAYARAAVRYKPDETAILEPGHLEGFMTQRRSWAEAHGAAPDAVERIFRALVEQSMQQQLRWYREGGRR